MNNDEFRKLLAKPSSGGGGGGGADEDDPKYRRKQKKRQHVELEVNETSVNVVMWGVWMGWGWLIGWYECEAMRCRRTAHAHVAVDGNQRNTHR